MYLTKQEAASITDKTQPNIKFDQKMGQYSINWPDDVVCYMHYWVNSPQCAGEADCSRNSINAEQWIANHNDLGR
jgi:hypothetical protein